MYCSVALVEPDSNSGAKSHEQTDDAPECEDQLSAGSEGDDEFSFSKSARQRWRSASTVGGIMYFLDTVLDSGEQGASIAGSVAVFVQSVIGGGLLAYLYGTTHPDAHPPR